MILKKLLSAIEKSGKKSEHQYVPLGLLGFFSFIIYYFIWNIATPNEYNSITLRVIGGILCLLLILKDKWPAVLKPFLPYYWYFTVIYTMPFFFTFMLFKNPNSVTWLLTTMTGLLLMMLLVDFVALIILTIVGVSLAWSIYMISTDVIQYPINFISSSPTYIMIIIARAMISTRTEYVLQEKYKSMKIVAASIAHELRTPLRTLGSIARSLEKKLPSLLAGFQEAQSHGLSVNELSKSDQDFLSNIPNDIAAEVSESSNIIDMLLTNVNLSSDQELSFVICSMKASVNAALQNYVLEQEQGKIINIDGVEDFDYFGSEFLVMHILFNLMKNALIAINTARKGSIIIWTETHNNYHELHFKDTALGISQKDLPRIFDQFYTKTKHGTGIGLSFCQLAMMRMNGEILCISEQNVFAEFILRFPKVS